MLVPSSSFPSYSDRLHERLHLFKLWWSLCHLQVWSQSYNSEVTRLHIRLAICSFQNPDYTTLLPFRNTVICPLPIFRHLFHSFQFFKNYWQQFYNFFGWVSQHLGIEFSQVWRMKSLTEASCSLTILAPILDFNYLLTMFVPHFQLWSLSLS